MEKLKKCAEFLNELMGLDPEISVNKKISEKELKEKIKDAVIELYPTDELDNNTIDVLASMGLKQNKTENGVVPINDDISLYEEVEKCDHFAHLKKMVKNHDEFISIRAIIKKYKTKKDLKTKMLSLLNTADISEETKETIEDKEIVEDKETVETGENEVIEDKKVVKDKEKEKEVKEHSNQTVVIEKKKINQTELIRKAIKEKKSKIQIETLLAKKLKKTEAWAKNRIKLYEKVYGEMGINDKNI